MPEGIEVQESVSQNTNQSGMGGGQGPSAVDDLANAAFDAPETGQDEIQTAPELADLGEAEKKLQKNRARWEKILNERKQDREKLKALEEQYESKEFKSAAMLRDLLKSRPQYASMLLRLFNGENPQQVVNEIFRQEQAAEAAQQRAPEEEYDERTASYFKKIEELDRWKAQQEQERQSYMDQQVGKYQEDLNFEYKRRLTEDGFFDQSGKPVDETYVGMVDNVMRAILKTSAQNPDIPTAQEFDQAYSTVKQCLKYMEDKIRRDMSKKSVSDVPPLSGTARGQMPIGKSKLSDHERFMDLANSFYDG